MGPLAGGSMPRDRADRSVGWHADQLTYLGPHTTIASVSLGTARAFRLRPTDTVDSAFSDGKPIRTYEVMLRHNTLTLMNAGCQERFKHTCVNCTSPDSSDVQYTASESVGSLSTRVGHGAEGHTVRRAKDVYVANQHHISILPRRLATNAS